MVQRVHRYHANAWVGRTLTFEYANVETSPHGELLYLRPLPATSIREVILGYLSSTLLADSILKVALDENRYELRIEPS